MNKKLLITAALAVLLGGGGAYGYFMVFDPLNVEEVIEPDVEVPLEGVLVQFDADGVNRLMLLDMVMYVRPEHEEAVKSSGTKVRNHVVMHLLKDVEGLYLKPTFEMELQDNVSLFLNGQEDYQVESALITRVVVQ